MARERIASGLQDGGLQDGECAQPHVHFSATILLSLSLLTALWMLSIGCAKDVKTADTPAPAATVADETPTEKKPVEVPAESEPSGGDADPAADTGKGNQGELRIRFQFGGAAPGRARLNIPAQQQFCGQFVHFQEKLLVNPENKGIENVVVYLYTGRGGSELPDFEAKNRTVTLANQNCRFEPHILICQKGDTLRVTNPDQVGHNANLNFFNNKAENPTIPAGAEKLIPLTQVEPAPIPVDCNIHPWMKAYVLVLDHPFAAISDKNGDLSIKGLPVGEKLVFRAFQEAGRIGEVTVDGRATEWKRSRFEVDIQPGVNDLGTVVVPAESFQTN